MKNTNCLSEQDLILHYYSELPATVDQLRHLADCPLCAQRFTALSGDLARLPKLAHEADHAAATRMAARVNERLHGRRRSWMPVLVTSAVATIALVFSLSLWTSQSPQVETAQLATSSLTAMSLNEDMPDIDFLEDLEVLKELELLRQIEGV